MVPGCASQAPPVPAKDVSVAIQQGDLVWRLATVDADQDRSINVEVLIPAEVQVGEATLVANSAKLTVPVLEPALQ